MLTLQEGCVLRHLKFELVAQTWLSNAIRDAIEDLGYPQKTFKYNRGLMGDLQPPEAAAGGQVGHPKASQLVLHACVWETDSSTR